MSEELKSAVLEVFERFLKKGKKKLYVKDVVKGCPDYPRKEVKTQIQDMIDHELSYWSSGSTTFVMLKSEFEKYQEEMEHGSD